MNPYEMTFANTLSRVRAWLRGLARQYRRPLLVVLAATGMLAAGVSAGQAPNAPGQVIASK
jgi:anti-sigma factor RsiW